MSDLKNFLLNDPLARLEHEVAEVTVRERLEGYLAESANARRTVAIRPFVESVPWRFWNDATLANALQLLEGDVDRSCEAIRLRRQAISRGLDNLFRLGPMMVYEDRLDHSRPRDLIRIATELLPEYLRLTEHVYGNLLQLYWSVRKRGDVHGRFQLRGATDYLKQQKENWVVEGYSDRVRNAIAHGEVEFSFPDVRFGEAHPERYAPGELLSLFDNLVRTTNAMSLGLLLFWIRQKVGDKLDSQLPTAVVTRFAAGGVGRSGLEVVGAVESEMPGLGRQLHIGVRMTEKGRAVVLANAARVAAHMIDAGAREYDRMLIGVDHGRTVTSLVTILPKELEGLMAQDDAVEHLDRIFPETQLVWFDESIWIVRIRGWGVILKSALARARIEVVKGWHEAGIWRGKGRYRIRSIENVSTQGIPRVRVVAVLRRPKDAKDGDVVREVMAELVRRGRRRLVRSRGFELDPGIPWPRRPQHVFVDLYRDDGPLRWLRGGGWLGGNLLVVGERIWGRRSPVLVDNPEETYKNIRLRFSIDAQAAQAVSERLLKLVADHRARLLEQHDGDHTSHN